MSSRQQHQVQHRGNEEKSDPRLIKQQNRILRRQVSQMRKQIERLTALLSNYEQEAQENVAPEKPAEDLNCPICQKGPMKEHEFLKKIWRFCEHCKHRYARKIDDDQGRGGEVQG